MSKVIKVIVGVTLAVFAPQVLLMLGAATGSAALAAVAGTALGGVLLTTAIAVTGASLLSSGLAPNIKAFAQEIAEQGQRLRLSMNPLAVREILYGQGVTSGKLLYKEAIGTENEDLWLVIALAGHECEEIVSIDYGGQTLTLDGSGNVTAPAQYVGVIKIWTHLGTDTQTADANLTAASAIWSTTDKLQGVTYAVAQLIWDREKHANGLQNFTFNLKGRKVYNARLDSTNGGSGSHRHTDPSTWEWSENPADCIIDYMKGVRVANSATTAYDGTFIGGVGVDAARINWPSIISEANICDEAVALLAGGTQKRYTLNGWVNPSRGNKEVLSSMVASMAGAVVFQTGAWFMYAGAARAAVKTRTGNDALGSLSYRSNKPSSERINIVRGSYLDANNGYKPRKYADRTNATYVAEDGGFEYESELNLPFTNNAIMAQRIANIALERGRRDKLIKVTLPIIALQDKAMDTVLFTHAPFDISAKKFVITEWSFHLVDHEGVKIPVIEETLAEEDDAIYSWSTGDEILDATTSSFTRTNRINEGLDEFGGAVDFKTQVSSPTIDGSNTTDSTATTDLGGKPIHNATENKVFYRPDEPPASICSDGDIWVDVDSTNNKVYKRISGSWSLGSTEGAETGSSGNLLDEVGDALEDSHLKNSLQEYDDIQDAGGTKPDDNATNNIGALADKDNVDLATSEVLNRNADNITNVGLKQWSTPRRELGAGSLVASNPVTAVDAGGDATVNIAAHTAYLGDGTGISFGSGSVTGRSFEIFYYIYATVATLASGAQTVTYQSTTQKQIITQSDNYYYVGYVTTPADGDVPTDGGGGGGGGEIP